MAQPDNTSWLQDGWKVAEALFGGFMVVLAWLGSRITTRVESLEKTTVTREELKALFAEMREDRKAMHHENQTWMRRIEDKLDASEPGVIANRLGRAEMDIQDLRTWKHQVDPFIERKALP